MPPRIFLTILLSVIAAAAATVAIATLIVGDTGAPSIAFLSIVAMVALVILRRAAKW